MRKVIALVPEKTIAEHLAEANAHIQRADEHGARAKQIVEEAEADAKSKEAR